MAEDTAPQAGTESPTQPLSPAHAAEPARMGWSDQIRVIGGLVAVAVGVVAVTVITLVALAKNSQTAGMIASAAGGVIASIVGAFFGVKLGTDQSRNAAEGERKQAAKAAVYAAHLPPEKADRVLGMAESIASGSAPPEAGAER
jgi:hypothetical protein